MLNLLRSVVLAGLGFFKTRCQLAIEVLALRHQLGVLKRSVKRPRLTNADRGLWVLLSRRWASWSDALIIVKPDTVIRWHRAGFRKYWAWRSRPKGGRPAIDPQIRALIRRMATAKIKELVSVDFFTVPTATFRVLFGFVVLVHHRRSIIHFNVTSSPSAAWAAQQITNAFPWDTAPRYMLRDRDRIYGAVFRRRMKAMTINEVLIAPRSPWQNPYVERVFSTLRRELLDHVIVLGEQHLRRLLRRYLDDYYHPCRTHLSLGKDSPAGREVEQPEMGDVIELPVVGGLHHRYTRRAA